jgi:3-hydroxyacyl-CoA dehydrogenase
MPADVEKVSVIGLGLMGSALARALLAKGYEVTVLESLAGEVRGVRGTRPRRQLRPRCVRFEQGDRCLPPEL